MSNIAYDTKICQDFLNISNKFQIEIVNYFIRSTDRYEHVYPSVKTIAREVGCHERTVHNHLPILEKIGILKHTYEHRHSSTYQLNVLLFTYINLFKEKFKALKRVIHLSIRYPKVSAILRCIKRAFRIDSLTQFLGSICRPLRKTLTSLKKSTVSLLTREREVVLSGEERKTFGLKIKVRRRRDMEQVQITPMLQKVTKRLSLSKAGQLKLILFPDQALEYALQKLTPTTSFNSFFIKAMDYCKDNNLEPDWAYHYEMMKKYNIPKDAKLVRTKTPTPTTFTAKETLKDSTRFHFEKSKRQRQERTKGDKEYEARVSYFQQFKPKFLEEEECNTSS